MSVNLETRANKLPSFTDFVELEQIRLLEGDQSALLPALAPELSFESAAVARGKSLATEQQWLEQLSRPDRLYRLLRIGLLLLVTVLGFLAISNALSVADSQRVINIYWLLLVLLGFNSLSLLLWLSGLLAKSSGLIGGAVGSLPLALHRFAARFTASKPPPEYSGWLQARFEGPVGLWRFSSEGHKLWLLYLVAGFIGLLVLFSVRQYDFVWGSTLLSPSVFVSLTATLSKPLLLFGLAPPDAAQIIASRNDGASAAIGSLDDVVRRQWALFLLGSLFVYGILPRLVCLVASQFTLSRFERRYRPDFYLPYYVELRHRHQPFSSNAEVVDADQHETQVSGLTVEGVGSGFSQLPAEAIRIGIELNQVDARYVDINVTDRGSQQQALSLLQQRSSESVLVVVRVESPADRGVKRRIDQLLEDRKNSWLLVHRSEQETDVENSVDQWYQLAQAVGIAVDNIRHIELKKSGWAQ